jgi:hypothetical protein
MYKPGDEWGDSISFNGSRSGGDEGAQIAKVKTASLADLQARLLAVALRL